jgi:hypothetical protein
MKHNIFIIKTDRDAWQVKFAGLVIGEYEALQEAKDFAVGYGYGEKIEIWDNTELLETIQK